MNKIEIDDLSSGVPVDNRTDIEKQIDAQRQSQEQAYAQRIAELREIGQEGLSAPTSPRPCLRQFCSCLS